MWDWGDDWDWGDGWDWSTNKVNDLYIIELDTNDQHDLKAVYKRDKNKLGSEFKEENEYVALACHPNQNILVGVFAEM